MAVIRLAKRQLPLLEITGSGLYLGGSGSEIYIGAGDGLTVSGSNISLITPGTLSASSTNVASDSHTHAVNSVSDSTVGGEGQLLKSDVSGDLKLNVLTLATNGHVD